MEFCVARTRCHHKLYTYITKSYRQKINDNVIVHLQIVNTYKEIIKMYKLYYLYKTCYKLVGIVI